MSFKITAGAGFNQVSPRQLYKLCDERLESLRGVIFFIEGAMRLPTTWNNQSEGAERSFCVPGCVAEVAFQDADS
eukprot:2999769-Pyramimonas_sp.AAC.1